MQFTARCAASVKHNGIVKVLLTVESAPSSQDEHLLLNLLKSRGQLQQGKIYRITIEEHHGDVAETHHGT